MSPTQLAVKPQADTAEDLFDLDLQLSEVGLPTGYATSTCSLGGTCTACGSCYTCNTCGRTGIPCLC
jgi:hypothetical protein